MRGDFRSIVYLPLIFDNNTSPSVRIFMGQYDTLMYIKIAKKSKSAMLYKQSNSKSKTNQPVVTQASTTPSSNMPARSG
jgi:hypothetical protein